MNLPLIQTEVSSKEKKQVSYINVYIYIYMESRKMILMNLVENGLVDAVREGKGGAN